VRVADVLPLDRREVKLAVNVPYVLFVLLEHQLVVVHLLHHLNLGVGAPCSEPVGADLLRHGLSLFLVFRCSLARAGSNHLFISEHLTDERMIQVEVAAVVHVSRLRAGLTRVLAMALPAFLHFLVPFLQVSLEGGLLAQEQLCCILLRLSQLLLRGGRADVQLDVGSELGVINLLAHRLLGELRLALAGHLMVKRLIRVIRHLVLPLRDILLLQLLLDSFRPLLAGRWSVLLIDGDMLSSRGET